MEALSVFICDFNFPLKVPKSKGYMLLNLIKISAAEKHFKNQSIDYSLWNIRSENILVVQMLYYSNCIFEKNLILFEQVEALRIFLCDSNFLKNFLKFQRLYFITDLMKISAAEQHFKNQSIEEDQQDISHILCRSEGLKCKKT